MGRPVKIKHGSTIDIGFNNPNTTDYYGVVGGVDTDSTTANPTIKVRVFPTDNSTGAEGDGFIIRQKGSKKFLVGMSTGIDPENAVVGTAIRIEALGDTDWEAMGAPATYAVGTIFTVTAASAAGTTGTANECGVCTLADEADAALTEGNMTVTVIEADSSEARLDYLSNRWGKTFTTGNDANGWPNLATRTFYLLNFFDVSDATIVKSGADADTWASPQETDGTVDMVQVDNWNLYG